MIRDGRCYAQAPPFLPLQYRRQTFAVRPRFAKRPVLALRNCSRHFFAGFFIALPSLAPAALGALARTPRRETGAHAPIAARARAARAAAGARPELGSLAHGAASRLPTATTSAAGRALADHPAALREAATLLQTPIALETLLHFLTSLGEDDRPNRAFVSASPRAFPKFDFTGLGEAPVTRRTPPLCAGLAFGARQQVLMGQRIRSAGWQSKPRSRRPGRA